jgi:formylglycine-generating enzyme required for sulfatase activity
MRFAQLPRGEFTMGSPETELDRGRDEEQHTVRIRRDVWMGVFEVTRRQYEHVMGRAEWEAQPGAENLPADNVPWQRAVEFCEKLSHREGVRYRLPTEAEWEYACRAGSTGTHSGDLDFDQIAWHADNAEHRLHPVGKLAPNAWGLYDMHGNVAEWCSDIYQGTYPSDPQDDPAGPAFGFQKVARGGNITNTRRYYRAASRISRDSEAAGRGFGFRVVLERTSDTARAD